MPSPLLPSLIGDCKHCRRFRGREGQWRSDEKPTRAGRKCTGCKPRGTTNVSASAGAQANDAMGDGNVGHPTQEILKQSETSAAALMAAYSTFGDKALPFVPFSPPSTCVCRPGLLMLKDIATANLTESSQPGACTAFKCTSSCLWHKAQQ